MAAGALLALASACAHEPAPTPMWRGDYAITDVAVVDVIGDNVLAARTVLIDDGKIVHVSEAGETILLAPDVIVINGRGRYLAPGLADMHVHVWDANELPIYVSYGVTTVRNMWGEDVTLSMRQGVERGEIVGPRIVTAGPIIDGAPKIWPSSVEAATPEAARTAVRTQIEEGYDFIKVYSNLSVDSFDAVAATAREAEIPFAGHVPEAVPIRHALAAGMASMEHLYGFDAATLRAGVNFGSGRFSSPERVAIARQISAGERTFDDFFDDEALEELASEIGATRTVIVPTLLVGRQLALTRAQARTEFERPEVAYLLPGVRQIWNPDNVFRRRQVSDEDLAALQIYNGLALRRVRSLYQAGAVILAGSDAPNPYVFHGLALHEELSLLFEAGLPPVAAIRAATSSAAAFLGETGEWGVIAEGARADLVLLSANPLSDVANYRAIEGVMLQGRWLDREALISLRAASAAAFTAMETQGSIDSDDLSQTGWLDD